MWFGRIPEPALWVFNNVGLNGFIAVVGLNAAPGLVSGLEGRHVRHRDPVRYEMKRAKWDKKMRALVFLLAFTAGAVDVIGFLGLGGLFTAHVTGNLVILAAHLVVGADASLALLISVPTFIFALAATRLAEAGLDRARIGPLGVLLFAHLVLLCAFLGICVAAGPDASPAAPMLIVAAILGVAAMGVQTALVRIALPGAPATAVLTTNITLLTVDVGEMLLGKDAAGLRQARERAGKTWPAVAGFLLGCALGAASEAALGLRTLVLPTACALVTFALGVTRSSPLPRHPGATTDERPSFLESQS